MAYGVGLLVYREYSSPYSRKRFMLPQLFACLALHEHQRESYRGIGALLRDCPDWCAEIGMSRPPDHATLRRAAGRLINKGKVERMLDHQVIAANRARLLGNTAAIDSTQFDVRYRSRHYEQRCRHFAKTSKRSADSKRSRSAKRTPKLAICIDIRCHRVLSYKPRTGMGSDAPDFLPVVCRAKSRHRKIKWILADSGYDSHENHRVSREKLDICTLIKAEIGRPSVKPRPLFCILSARVWVV